MDKWPYKGHHCEGANHQANCWMLGSGDDARGCCLVKFELRICFLPLFEPRRRKKYASDATDFDSLDVFYFGALVRPGVDGVCQPRRPLHVPFPEPTEGN